MAQVLTSAPGSLAVSERVEERLRSGELTQAQVDDFRDFLAEVDRDLLNHRIIKDNAYTRWLQKGEATDQELKHFIKQFSVFSNQFLVAELGVVYRKPNQSVAAGNGSKSDEQKDLEGDPELVNIEGTVDGSVYRHRAAHYEWLLGVGEPLGLGYKDLGKRWHGRPTTLHFCNELQRIYGSEDPMIAEGASFAVENWAAAGFWQEIEDGLLKIKKTRIPNLRLAFFTWHNRVEGQHAGHVMEELEETYFAPAFDREKFFKGGREMLDGVAVFWDGLEQDRLNRVYT